MSTGWKYVASDGSEFKSQMSAAAYSNAYPELTWEFSELSMAGTRLTDVTQQVKKRALVYSVRAAAK